MQPGTTHNLERHVVQLLKSIVIFKASTAFLPLSFAIISLPTLFYSAVLAYLCYSVMKSLMLHKLLIEAALPAPAAAATPAYRVTDGSTSCWLAVSHIQEASHHS